MKPPAAAPASPPLPTLLFSPAGLHRPRRSAAPFPPRPRSPVSSLSPAATISASSPSPPSTLPPPCAALSRRALLFAAVSAAASSPIAPDVPSSEAAGPAAAEFFEIEGSGGVRALDLRAGDGDVPTNGDQVAIHYYGRLAAKRGWRFDSTYDHKDESGDAVPFVFIVGSGKVIPGINVAVKSMRVGGIRRVIIPPSQGYQNMSQEPLPPNKVILLLRRMPNSSNPPTRLRPAPDPCSVEKWRPRRLRPCLHQPSPMRVTVYLHLQQSGSSASDGSEVGWQLHHPLGPIFLSNSPASSCNCEQ